MHLTRQARGAGGGDEGGARASLSPGLESQTLDVDKHTVGMGVGCGLWMCMRCGMEGGGRDTPVDGSVVCTQSVILAKGDSGRPLGLKSCVGGRVRGSSSSCTACASWTGTLQGDRSWDGWQPYCQVAQHAAPSWTGPVWETE